MLSNIGGNKLDFNDYPKVSLASDVVILTTESIKQEDIRAVPLQGIQVLLVKREDDTFKDMWALPGGFIDASRGIQECIEDKLREKTGLEEVYMEQLKTYGDDINRDPRGRVISVAYMALARKTELNRKMLSISDRVAWFWVSMKRDIKNDVIDIELYNDSLNLKVTELAFDHKQIIIDTLNRIKNKIEYTDIAFNFVPEYFTVRNLQTVYEAILGYPVASFRRKIGHKIIETDKVVTGEGHRPAALYRYKNNKIGGM